MNVPPGNAFPTGRPQPYGGSQQTAMPRAPGAGTAERATASRETDGRETAPRANQVRPDLDLSDSALTRRDIPRGTLINIVA